ncbi:MAG: hypothetical protein CSA04_06105 [Bacteroidetes bacterium]|nr:MAG: hypothetical protein CSA04_06105 [Bacteroidota bacterium]
MRKEITMLCLLLLVGGAFAQEELIIEVEPNGKDIRIYPVIDTDQDITFYINQYGNPSIEVSGNATFQWSEYKDATEGKPEKINDTRFSYYNNLDHNGFLASFGDIELTYYDRMPGVANSTRLHYINDMEIKYFDVMEGPEKQGKIKSIDGVKFNYYYGFDNRGKLSKVGFLRIYYNMEDPGNGSSGKIDAIEGNDNRIALHVRYGFNQHHK